MRVFKKRAGETITLRFEFARALETVWAPGTAYTAGDFVRPTVPNGFEYEATSAGDNQSGAAEPRWPRTVADTVVDGSVTWTCRAFGLSASDTISTQSVAADTGLTLAGAAIDGTGVTVNVSAGKKGACYDVECEIETATGQIFEEAITVEITD